jgi:hypothetical protein
MRSQGPYKGTPSLKSESFTGAGDSGSESDSNGDGENGEGSKGLKNHNKYRVAEVQMSHQFN